MHAVHSLSIGTNIEQTIYENSALCSDSCLFQPLVFVTKLALLSPITSNIEVDVPFSL